MMLTFRTKAETLADLRPHLKQAEVLPLYLFNAADWSQRSAEILAVVLEQFGSDTPLIVRSSARAEDQRASSLAGHFTSVLNVCGEAALRQAIASVIASFGVSAAADQVFVQPLLHEVVCSGVLFSADPSTGAPWLSFNYQDYSSDTTAVTAGQTNDLKTWCYYTLKNPTSPPPRFAALPLLLAELETYFGAIPLDLELACCEGGRWVLLQVRPLTLGTHLEVHRHRCEMVQIAEFLAPMQSSHPFLHGQRTVYGVMPDWNPAEMIGIRPRPLALSLYRELITDSIWAYQRHNYGYRNLRSFPLMVDLGGCPYIDVRVSFNSFIPATLPPALAEKLADYYLQRLVETPSSHDKVEFEIIYSCYTLDLPERLRVLPAHHFSVEECQLLAESLRALTNRIIHPDSGLWQKDIARLEALTQRRRDLLAAQLSPLQRIYWLLEDCKRYGTLPFAGLARAGFIAVQMLNSLVRVGALSESERMRFMQSLNTVSSRIQRDFQQLEGTEFLAIYGHLRPGTYDILSERYDQASERYFTPGSASAGASESEPFSLSLEQFKQIRAHLQAHGLDLDVLELFEFMQAAIEGREYAKFLFTRNLSDLLEEIAALGAHYGLSREDCSYLNIQVLRALTHASSAPEQALQQAAQQGRALYARTQALVLPPLITAPEDIWQFELQPGQPNFITLARAQGPVCFCDHSPERLRGSILLIPSADPGYDWIFAHGIAGLITLYGGANSHMAIRAGEMGIPAVIGAGEVLYSQWEKARELSLDCAARQVQILA